MNYVFYATLFLFIFGYSLRFNWLDYDFCARLIVGKTFFQTGKVLNWDFISYMPTHRFVDHEWGSSLVFYFLQSHFGDLGLFLFKALVYFTIFFIITKIIKLHKKDAKLHFLFFFFAINSIPGIMFTTIRCQIFSFFFFVLWLYTLERVRKNGETRLLWILPATMIFWSNMHGGCAAGFGLLAMYILGELLNGKSVRKYLITFFICCLALFINPYGFEYIKFLFMALTLKRTSITEWQSSFSYVSSNRWRYIAYFTAFTTVMSIYFIKNFIKEKNLYKMYKNADKVKLIILIVTFALAIKSIRLQYFWVLSTVAFCYNDFYEIFSKKLPKLWDIPKDLFLLEIMIIFAISTSYEYKFLCGVSNFPFTEVEYIKQNNIKGNVLCEFHHGSFVAYKLYPNNLIFMDGKYEEVYYNDLIQKLNAIFMAPDDKWEEPLKKYNIQIIALPSNYRLVKKLKNSKNYKMVERSKEHVLFLRNDVKRPINPKRPSEDGEYYIKTKFKTDIDWR